MIVLFDGVCNLCSSSVQFILSRDKAGLFHYASLQSDFGQTFLASHNLSQEDFDSVILIEGEQFFVKSDAALRISSRLGGLWSLLGIGKFLPKKIRDAVYDFIARRRYRWFGRKETCWLPKAEWKGRFMG
jgi:predicted DCC family thiol-disulfide oxidoreductase YuxK